MQVRTRSGGGPEAGMALVAALITVFSAGALLSVALTMARANDKLVGVDTEALQARFRAEGGLEVATRRTQELIANWQPPVAPIVETVDIGGTQVAYQVQPNGFVQVVTQTSGIKDFATGYEITATALVGDARRTMRRIIKAQATPIFQFAVFYTDELEVHNGAEMTLAGRVHSNSDMFLSPNGPTLTMDTNYVHAVGDIYRHFKFNPDKSNGLVMIRKWVDNPFDPFEPEEYEAMLSKSQLEALFLADSTSGYDSNFDDFIDFNEDGDYDDQFDLLPFEFGALELWGEPDGYTKGSGSTIQTEDHGLSSAVTPDIGSIKMFNEVEPGDGTHVLDEASGLYVPAAGGTHDEGFFSETAGLKFILEPDGSGGEALKAYGPGGSDLTSALVDTGIVYVNEVFDARQDASDSTGLAKVKVIEVDIAQLNTTQHFPQNGLMYASSYFLGEGNASGGVKLVNGAELSGPLTVVGEGSVYIQGDYNTVAKKGAAAIGDAVNLLSNDWDDTKAPGSLPKAADTTYNLALITGNRTTTSSSYNGGLENLPRFHENWSGKTASINGSFVNTWESELATGQWKYGGDRYTAPRRDWSYDDDFNDFSKLPPYTPLAVWAEEVTTW
ncbi:MAG: hypothetical protein AAFZ65_14225 [Planctomycetota bacterium]